MTTKALVMVELTIEHSPLLQNEIPEVINEMEYSFSSTVEDSEVTNTEILKVEISGRD